MELNLNANKRREFLKQTLISAGFIICSGGMTTLLNSCTTPFNAVPLGTATLDISKVPELSKDGGVVEKSFSGQFEDTPVIIIRESSTSYLAFSTVCTHYGKKVSSPENSSSDIICHAHNAHFSPKDGRVLSGPAKSGLTKYTTSVDTTKNFLTISK